MNVKEIYNALDKLTAISKELERNYIENGGEVTADSIALEDEAEAVGQLLTEDGIDSLGRWLKAKEDEAAALKAEKAAILRHLEANANTQSFIKQIVGSILQATGKDRVKGTLYGFSQYESITTKTDTAALKELYQQRALDAVHAAGIPAYVTVTLGASVQLVPDGSELPGVFKQDKVLTSKLSKPRKVKGDEEDEA